MERSAWSAARRAQRVERSATIAARLAQRSKRSAPDRRAERKINAKYYQAIVLRLEFLIHTDIIFCRRRGQVIWLIRKSAAPTGDQLRKLAQMTDTTFMVDYELMDPKSSQSTMSPHGKETGVSFDIVGETT